MIQPDVTGRFVPRSSKQRREDEDTIRFSKTVVQRAMEEKKAILSADASSDERFSMSESIADFRIRSVMCVPLLGVDQRSLGVIQLDTQSYTQRFSEDDLQVLTSVANQAAIAMENARLHEEMLIQERMRRELSFAREVQQGFLPRFMPKVNGYEFWGFYEAAGLIGGDYYDFVQLPEGRQAVIVADVSGKGVPGGTADGSILERREGLPSHAPEQPGTGGLALESNPLRCRSGRSFRHHGGLGHRPRQTSRPGRQCGAHVADGSPSRRDDR